MILAAKAGMFGNIWRGICIFLDRIVYQLLVWVYEIFFTVAEQNNLFNQDTYLYIFRRIFMILGIFMLFKLSISLLQIIVSPDENNKQQSKMGQVIGRVIVVVVLIFALVPQPSLNNSDPNSLEAKIKTDGLLFGTLNSLQERVLRGNFLGKLILGSSAAETSSKQGTAIQEGGNQIASTIFRAFFYPNKSCGQIAIYDDWSNNATDVQDLMDLYQETCSNKEYAFEYMGLVSTLAGGFAVFMIFSFTLDVAIRLFKLLFLRLIAPIPVISYIDPKSAKDGAFANWVKVTTSTYLELFIHLIIIFLMLFLVREVIQSEFFKNIFTFDNNFSIITVIAGVFIILGIFFFARQAPKFIRDIFGIKGGSGSIGLAGMLGGAAALVGGAGLAGAGAAMLQNSMASSDAAAQGKQFSGGWRAGSDLAAQIRTGDKNARGGLINRAQQAAQRRAGARQADQLGLTRDNVQFAKDKMYETQNQETEATDAYNRFINSDVYKSNPAGEEAHRQTLYNNMVSAQAAAAKAKSNYEKASKGREQLAGPETLQDRYGPRYFARRRLNREERRRNARRPVGSHYTEDADHARGSDRFDQPPI